jgi:AraC-like DNA-binding protein
MTVPSFLQKFSFFNPEINSPLLLAHKKDIALVTELFEKIAGEYTNRQTGSFDIIYYYVFILLTHVSRFLSKDAKSLPASPDNKRNASLLKAFEALVRKHFMARKTVKEYADLLNVTPKYLSEALKNESGKTAQQIIQETLMLEARSLLLQTELSIAEISHRLGFADPSHFARVFKSKIGQTPTAFLKKR